MDKVIILFVFMILTAIFGGALGRFFGRPDIADLIGTTIMWLIGCIVLFVGVCYGIASLKLRYIQKRSQFREGSAEPSSEYGKQETIQQNNPEHGGGM